MNKKLLITIDEARNMLGVGRSKIYELAHSAGFPAISIGRRIYINAQKLNEWVEKQSSDNSCE